MKKTIILLVIFVVLGSGTAWYLTSGKKNEKTTYKKTAEMDFAVDANEVYKIFINDRKGNKSLLTRNGDHWLIDNKHKVRPSAIAMLLNAMSRLEVKYRPPKTAYENIINDFATIGIEVEAYNKNGDLIKNYYVGNGDHDGTGTYMIMADSDEPFAMSLPGFKGSLRPRYFLVGEDWRDRAVFSEKAEDIQSVTVEYPKQRNKSFRLERVGDKDYTIEPFYEGIPLITRDYAKGKAEKYLSNFESLVAEAFQNDNEKRDSISALVPFCHITVTKKDGEVKSVRFFPYTRVDKYGNPIPEPAGYPVFRMNADCSWGDFMLVQQNVFKDVFWSYESFFETS